MEIVLHNNITGEILSDDNLLDSSKAVVDYLINQGYSESFAFQAAAVFEWGNTLGFEDRDVLRKIIKFFK